jgi:hypothetical protein
MSSIIIVVETVQGLSTKPNTFLPLVQVEILGQELHLSLRLPEELVLVEMLNFINYGSDHKYRKER